MAIKNPKERTDLEFAKSVLRKVSGTESFLFYTNIGQYTGDFSSSLSDFIEKLKKIPLEAVKFHQSRGDFQNWIRETLKDKYLADRIDQIDKSLTGEALRQALEKRVQDRLDFLKKLVENR